MDTASGALFRCGRCKAWKTADLFHKNRTRKTGLQVNCKICNIDNVKQRYHTDTEFRERLKAQSAKRSRDFSDEISQARRDRYRNDAEYRERIKAAVREWDKAHPESRRKRDGMRRARELSAPTVPYSGHQLAQRWAYYGGNCWMCGQVATCTDHVKPIARGGAEMLCNMRPACYQCNATKHAKWPYRRGVEF